MPELVPPATLPILPAHIEDTIQAIAKLHSDQRLEAGPLQRVVERSTAWVGRPRFIAGLTLIIALWVVANLFVAAIGATIWDPPPFAWLQGILGLLALYVTVLTLSTQRREDQLAGYREQLTLELAILGEQKSAKIIALLEEIRRDSTTLHNRVDSEAAWPFPLTRRSYLRRPRSQNRWQPLPTRSRKPLARCSNRRLLLTLPAKSPLLLGTSAFEGQDRRRAAPFQFGTAPGITSQPMVARASPGPAVATSCTINAVNGTMALSSVTARHNFPVNRAKVLQQSVNALHFLGRDPDADHGPPPV